MINLEKIKKIAYKGNEYEIGESGNNDIRIADFDGGFLLLKKVCPGIVIAFLSVGVWGKNSIRAIGDFAGFEGSTIMLLNGSGSTKTHQTNLTVERAAFSISFGEQAYVSSDTSGTGIYRVKPTK